MLSFLWGAPFKDPQICADAVAAVARDSARLPALQLDGVGVGADGTDTSEHARRLLVAAEVIINGGLELAINIENATALWPARLNATLGDVLRFLAPVLNAGGAVTWRTATRLCCEHGNWDNPRPTGCVNRAREPLRPVEEVGRRPRSLRPARAVSALARAARETTRGAEGARTSAVRVPRKARGGGMEKGGEAGELASREHGSVVARSAVRTARSSRPRSRPSPLTRATTTRQQRRRRQRRAARARDRR